MVRASGGALSTAMAAALALVVSAQGLRSEAIQFAESEPRLLDAVTALDFPERTEWDELVGIYSLAASPKLTIEAKTSLADAYPCTAWQG